MRLAVVGCGYWGQKHVRVLTGLSAVDQVCLVDPLESRRDALSRAYPGVRGFADLNAALPHVDAVIIATPPRTHAALASRGLAAGKHVLVEKPLATASSAARALTRQAEECGLTLMVGHTFQYNAAVWKLRELICQNELGDVYYIDAARLNLGLYQADVNVVWDLAPHDISIVDYLLGSTPTSVQAWGAAYANAVLEDVAYLRLHYSEVGVTAQINLSWLAPQKVRRVTVVGSRKMAVYNDVAADERLRIYDKGVTSGPTSGGETDMPMFYRYGSIVSPFVAADEPLRVMDESFLRCVTEGQRPQSDGWSGLSVVQVIEAAQESLLRGNTAVPVEPVPELFPDLSVRPRQADEADADTLTAI